MDIKELFVIGGDFVFLKNDFTPPNDYYSGVTVKRGIIEVDGRSDRIYTDEFLCYPDTVVDKEGNTIPNQHGFYISLNLCEMHETKWKHLPEKEYSDE